MIDSIFKDNSVFEALINNASIGIVVVDDQGKIVIINDFALKQFGYNGSELLGEPIERLIPMRYAHRHVKHRDHYIADNNHTRPMGSGLDLFGLKKDGSELPVEISLSSFQKDQHRFTLAFVNDITVRKRSEEALIQMNARLEDIVNDRTATLSDTVAQLEHKIKEATEMDLQLRQSLEKQKELNELKSRFVSMASHEFRTPLSTILSSAYLVTKYIKEEEQPKREKHIDRIISSVNMLNDILNDFLSVGKIEEGRIQVRFTDFNIAQLIQHTLTEIAPIAKKGQDLVYHHQGPEEVNLDISLLKHILMNLISNAIKFSPEEIPIEIYSEVTQDVIILTVADKGMGISAEDQKHLFERFFRGANVTNIQGTGLGLHIISKYAELMHGSIQCESSLGLGTKFIIHFKIQST